MKYLKITVLVAFLSYLICLVGLVYSDEISDNWFNAVESGNAERVEALISEGIDLELRDNNDNTGLIVASSLGLYEIVKLLIDNNVDLENVGRHDLTALAIAGTYGHPTVVRLLLDSGAILPVDSRILGTIFGDAILANDKKLVQYFKRNGVPPDIIGRHREPVIMHALSSDRKVILEILLENLSDINLADPIKKKTLLIQAVLNGEKEIAELLINQGADVNLVDTDGFSALMIAAKQNRPQLAKLLIDKDAQVDVFEKNYHSSVLMTAVKSESTEIVQLLLDQKVNVNFRDIYGSTALLKAKLKKNGEIIKLLVNVGASEELFTSDITLEYAQITKIELGNLESAFRQWFRTKQINLRDLKKVPEWSKMTEFIRQETPLWHRNGLDVLGNPFEFDLKRVSCYIGLKSFNAFRSVTGNEQNSREFWGRYSPPDFK